MKYAPELRNLVIRNLKIIEKAPEIVEEIERAVFKNINEQCKDFAEKMSWVGSFDAVITEKGTTDFYPDDWMNREHGKQVCGYYLYGQENEDRHWLSLLLGLYAEEFCAFQFSISYAQLNVGKPDFRKELWKFFEQAPKLKELGFLVKDDFLLLPFHVDQDQLIVDQKTALVTIDEALTKIKEAHPILQSIKEKIIEKYGYKHEVK